MSQQPPMKLRDWIDCDLDMKGLFANPNYIEFIEKEIQRIPRACAFLYSYYLSSNPNAVHILEKYPEYIHWEALSKNPNATHILLKNMDKIDRSYFCENPHPDVIKYLEKNTDKISWCSLATNPSAMHLLKQKIAEIKYKYHPVVFPFEIDFEMFCLNPNPEAIEIIKQYPEEIEYYDAWTFLASNPNAVELLSQNLDEIDWDLFTRNTSPDAIALLEQNLDKLNWGDCFLEMHLLRNPAAIHIIERNWHKIEHKSIDEFSSNPAIFVYDYARMRENYKDLKREIIETAWHPNRVSKWLEMGLDLEDL